MAKASEFFNHLNRDVFVGVKARHASRGLVGGDLGLNLARVRADISPGIGQVLSPQGGVCHQQLLFAGAKAPGLFKQPDRNPRPDQARLLSADTRQGVDSREVLPKFLDNPLEKERLLSPSEGWEEFFHLVQVRHVRIVAGDRRNREGERQCFNRDCARKSS